MIYELGEVRVNSVRLMMDLPKVISSAYSISSPIDTPRAMTLILTS